MKGDVKRLEWMATRGARVTHSMDGEVCNVWMPADRDGNDEYPAEGYPQKNYYDWREAIDKAMEAEP